MNRAVLIGAVLVLALLAAFYYFVDIRGREEAGQEETAGRRLVADFDHQLVRAVSIDPAGGPALRVSRVGAEDTWQVAAPQPVEADPQVVRRLLETLAQLTAREAPFSPGDDGLAPYGLEPPRLAVTVSGEGGAELARLELGGPAPFGASRYAAVRDTGQVGQVDAAETEAIPDTLFDLREKRLVQFSREEVRRVRIEVAENTAVSIRREGDDWEITEPLRFSAGRELVGNLLWELTECRALEFPGNEEEADSLDRPAIRIVLTLADGSETVARFGALAESGEGVIAAGDSGPVMRVDATVVRSALRPAEGWRELRPFPRYSWEVEGISVSSAGDDPVTWRQDEDGAWQREGGTPDDVPLPEDSIRRAIDLLTGLEACSLTLVGGAAVMEASGLEEPAFTVTLSGGAVEAVTVESLALGFPDREAVPVPDACAGEEPLICGLRPESDWMYVINEPGREELRIVLEKLCSGE